MKFISTSFLLGFFFLYTSPAKAEQITQCQSEFCQHYFNEFKKGAKRGHIRAYSALGQFYYVGYGTEKNEAEGVKYMYKAARLGEVSAQYLIGVISISNEDFFDAKRAVKYLKKAAKFDYKDANYILGTLFINDKLVAKDYKEADYYLARAYEQRDLRVPELIASIADDLKNHEKHFPKLTTAMLEQPLMTSNTGEVSWPADEIEVLTITAPPLEERFKQELVTFKKRKKTTGSKFLGKSCGQQTGCYQERLNGTSIDTYFRVSYHG